MRPRRLFPTRWWLRRVSLAASIARISHSYSHDDWTALTDGDVLTPKVALETRSNQQGTVQAMGIIQHAPARVWATLVDFASRPRFQPGTKQVRVVQVDGNRVWLAEHLRFFLVDIRFTVVNTLDPSAGTIRWVLDESPPHDIAGAQGRGSSPRLRTAAIRSLPIVRGSTRDGMFLRSSSRPCCNARYRASSPASATKSSGARIRLDRSGT
jgi:hypothetical protein